MLTCLHTSLLKRTSVTERQSSYCAFVDAALQGWHIPGSYHTTHLTTHTRTHTRTHARTHTDQFIPPFPLVPLACTYIIPKHFDINQYFINKIFIRRSPLLNLLDIVAISSKMQNGTNGTTEYCNHGTCLRRGDCRIVL